MTLYLIETIKRKGVIETMWHLFSILIGGIGSLFMIVLLRIRGYIVSYTASISSSAVFFQSTTRAIKIGNNTRIGQGTRISAGYEGTIEIGTNVLIDDYSFIMAQNHIYVGSNTQISAFCFITDFNHRTDDTNAAIKDQGYERLPVIIGEDVWIGTHSIILSGVTIGRGAVIGAGSIVTKSVKPYAIVVGNPLRVIRFRK